jgi:hypothetical protein
MNDSVNDKQNLSKPKYQRFVGGRPGQNFQKVIKDRWLGAYLREVPGPKNLVIHQQISHLHAPAQPTHTIPPLPKGPS